MLALQHQDKHKQLHAIDLLLCLQPHQRRHGNTRVYAQSAHTLRMPEQDASGTINTCVNENHIANQPRVYVGVSAGRAELTPTGW